jgi:predicted acylesterase/phospholipase RssA
MPPLAGRLDACYAGHGDRPVAFEMASSLRSVARNERMARRGPRTRVEAMKKHRILSIDGGGIKGVFPISFLSEIEKTLKLQSVGNYFDLIAGTSVGGIIALGLGLGLSAGELAEFFVKEGPVLFPPHGFSSRALRLFLGTEKYKPDHLERALAKAFGSKILADSRVRLVIPAFDATCADIHIYKTAHHRRLETDYHLKAVEVAMATAAAPTYFPAYDSKHSITLVDGGIWANNPTAIAVVEGVTVLGWSGDEIDVLSLGCTEETIDFKEKGHGRFFWFRRAMQASMRGQSRAALGTARHLTGRDKKMENIFRVDPSVAPGRFSLDDAKGIGDLQGFAYDQARKSLPDIKSRFFETEAEPFDSLRRDRVVGASA